MVQQSLFPNLSADHHRMGDLMMSIKVERQPEELERLATELDVILRKHFEVEERALYPTLLEAVDDWEDRIVLHGAHEDHRLIMHLLGELDDTSPTEERYKGKVHALNKLWAHHVEEEESALYHMARTYLDQDAFSRLTERIEAAQRAVEEPGFSHHGLPGTSG